MNDERKKQLLKYTKPSGVIPVICVVLAVVCFIFGLLMTVGTSVFDEDAIAGIAAFFVGGVIFILLYVYYRYRVSKIKKKIDEIENRGELMLLLDDFEQGGKAFNDSLILGRKYLIGKKTGTIVSYGEIVRIYQCIGRVNGIEDERKLQIVTAENKTLVLCKIPLRGKAEEEVNNVFAYVKSVNNNVALGYGT